MITCRDHPQRGTTTKFPPALTHPILCCRVCGKTLAAFPPMTTVSKAFKRAELIKEILLTPLGAEDRDFLLSIVDKFKLAPHEWERFYCIKGQYPQARTRTGRTNCDPENSS